MSYNQPQTIALPISASWMYMSDDLQYNTIPPFWSDINLKDVDVLNIGPAGIQADGTFGLYNSDATGDLANRFKWIIQRARSENPHVKIIVSQWWGDGHGVWGSALDLLTNEVAIVRYAESVAAFLQSYLNISGGVDGYDIDYESNNVVSNIDNITSQIRYSLDVLSQANGGRPFYLTVSPAVTSYLKTAVSSLSFVNMQNYADVAPEDFTQLGLKPEQLLYGICPESGCGGPTVEKAEAEYTENKLAGIHVWRLNSGNYAEEDRVQARVYSFLHP